MSGWGEDWLVPEWPAPANVRACVTTRRGGVSVAPFDSFNLGDHVGDDPVAVSWNRQHLRDTLGCEPIWLAQVHSNMAVHAAPGTCVTADASWSETPGQACAVLTADCLPVLFCDRAGTRVAAAHAGWRGLAGGILEATLEALAIPADQVLVWLGPAIGPAAFEIGPEVREAFLARHPAAAAAFCQASTPGVSWRTSTSLHVSVWRLSAFMQSTVAGCAASAMRVSTPTVVPRAPGASPA